MLRSSIDLGTNTCLLLIAECSPDGRVTKIIEDHVRTVRLGQDVARTGKLQPEAMKRTLDCLGDYAQKTRARGLKIEDAICAATAQARDAANGREFLERIEREAGFRFRILSGDEEAKYSFQGALLPTMNPAQCSVIDIGGGSTEIVSQDGGQSLPIGAVKMSERFFAETLKDHKAVVRDEDFWACQDEIDMQVAKMKSWREAFARKAPKPTFVGVAGTATTIAMLQSGIMTFDPALLDGLHVTRGDVHRWLEDLKWRSVEERAAILGPESGRADVLLAGTLILWRVMELLDFPVLTASTRGLRFGILGMKS